MNFENFILLWLQKFRFRKAKFYDKNSTQFFSEIIKDCILSDNGHLTETRCLNLNAAVGLTKTAAQNTIDVFLRDKWLVSKVRTFFL